MRISDQDREARRRATATMTKCACGNVARHGTAQCGRCAEATAEHLSEQRRRWELRKAVNDLDPDAPDFALDLRSILGLILDALHGEA